MFILPVVVTLIVSLIAMIVVFADYRVYSRDVRLEEIVSIFLPSIIAAGLISFILFLVGVR